MTHGGRLVVLAVGGGVLAWVLQARPAPAEEPPRPAAASAAAADGRVQAVALLNESRWAIELRRMFTRTNEPPLHDTLTFSRGALSSEWLAPRGYGPGGFTLSIGPAGAPVWESTQLNQQDGIVLWNGELDRDTIRGTVSRLPLSGDSEDFQFEGKEILAAPLAEAPSAAEAVPAGPQPETPTDAKE